MAEKPVIIIKKKKRGGHAAAHGGAWKVAFADFMTAMMAFFLVMWLVNERPRGQVVGAGALEGSGPVQVALMSRLLE